MDNLLAYGGAGGAETTENVVDGLVSTAAKVWRGFFESMAVGDEAQSKLNWLNKIESAIEQSSDEDLSAFPRQGQMKVTYDDWLI